MDKGAYHCAIVARECVKAGRVGLILILRTTLLIGMVQDIEAVMIKVSANKDIGDEFQD